MRFSHVLYRACILGALFIAACIPLISNEIYSSVKHRREYLSRKEARVLPINSALHIFNDSEDALRAFVPHSPANSIPGDSLIRNHAVTLTVVLDALRASGPGTVDPLRVGLGTLQLHLEHLSLLVSAIDVDNGLPLVHLLLRLSSEGRICAQDLQRTWVSVNALLSIAVAYLRDDTYAEASWSRHAAMVTLEEDLVRLMRHQLCEHLQMLASIRRCLSDFHDELFAIETISSQLREQSYSFILVRGSQTDLMLASVGVKSRLTQLMERRIRLMEQVSEGGWWASGIVAQAIDVIMGRIEALEALRDAFASASA
ncbi:uncharacterized protein SCHCODRAFT_02515010 [Schizophyllum commune H4-8]|nr:uncharacterized protein SCHCODRAFT_02515010 [Schizophyllum commune H4-8]KAI5887581.1 hypothetical protein SCHCODRAFT_02515010 [Schizophyllum commune H4-8]